MYNLANNKIDCAISFSVGIFPLINMLEKKYIKNAIMICPPTIENNNIFKNIKDCNILCIAL